MTITPRIMASISLSFLLVFVHDVGVASAQSNEATVQRTVVEDNFFNQCTGEVDDRSYTRHITRRKAGDDYILRHGAL